MTEGLPEPGTRVLLAMASGAMYPTEMDDVVDGQLVVGAPAVAPEDLPAVGDELEVRWFSVRGRHSMLVYLSVVTSSGYLAWYLDPAQPPTVRQDRQYVRAGGGEPATVTVGEGDERTAVSSTVVDLSERSVRLSVAAGTLTEGAEVTVGLNLSALGLVVPGQVYKVLAGHTEERDDVVVLLEATERQADTIRQYVFAAQRRERLRAAGR